MFLDILRVIVLSAFAIYLLWAIYPYVIRFWPYRPDDKDDNREVW